MPMALIRMSVWVLCGLLLNTLLLSASFVVAEQAPSSTAATQDKLAPLELGSRVHFNTNVSNFVKAREFYGRLGFQTLSGFPDANTLAMAEAIGITPPTSYDGSEGGEAGGYLLHGELIGVGRFEGGLIDLIEFTIPKNNEPPHSQLNHLGMARAELLTTNLDADYEYLRQQGVNFLDAPQQRADNRRFAIFTDLDGTFYELVEVPGEQQVLEHTHITGIGSVHINVSNLEQSLAWYRMFGFEVSENLDATENEEVAKALGFAEPIRIRSRLLTLPGDGSTLTITQWVAPFCATPAYPIPINHLGIHRMAFTSSDIEADVASLRAQGVEFVSDITPCCSGADSWGGIVAFYDPDGAIHELVEQPLMDEMLAVGRWFRRLFN